MLVELDDTRFPFSEVHLGKFPDSLEFQIWKVNFKTEVRSKSADPHLTMQWIKEVETAKSIDELVTSRSILERTDFPGYNMLDAIIASALKKLLNTHVHFRKRVSVEEGRAQKYNRFLRGRQIAFMTHEHFRATRAYEAVQGLSDLFNVLLQNDDVQDFDVRWDRAMLSASGNSHRCDPGRIVPVKVTGLCSASDYLGFERPRNCQKQWTIQLFKIEDFCETSC